MNTLLQKKVLSFKLKFGYINPKITTFKIRNIVKFPEVIKRENYRIRHVHKKGELCFFYYKNSWKQSKSIIKEC